MRRFLKGARSDTPMLDRLCASGGEWSLLARAFGFRVACLGYESEEHS